MKSLGEMGDLRCDVAVYRFEQLERENAELSKKALQLTARAEQAERRANESLDVIKQHIEWQKELKAKMDEILEKLGGQPQDGEGN